jgi:pyruvate/2-oxoglutarate dehydrogenase complex dihydrolipoamide acyltransferase (E2) component
MHKGQVVAVVDTSKAALDIEIWQGGTLQLKALALKKSPEFNGVFQDEQFKPAAAVHLGVAISLRQGGLIAPALHDVDSKPLGPLMQELAYLRARLPPQAAA